MTASHDLLALVRELPIPTPWNRERFVEAVAAMRNRPIRVATAPGDTPCGMWLVRDDEDVIVYGIETPDDQVDAIVCHQLGHMLLRHDAPRIVTDQHTASPRDHALSKLDPTMVQAVLGNADFGSTFAPDQEQDADALAGLILAAAS